MKFEERRSGTERIEDPSPHFSLVAILAARGGP